MNDNKYFSPVMDYRICLTLLHSEPPKLYGVLAVLSAIGLSILSLLLLAEVKYRYYFYSCISLASVNFHPFFFFFWLALCGDNVQKGKTLPYLANVIFEQ